MEQSKSSTSSHYVTPEELEACRKDPGWEARHGIADRVICRVCGGAPKFPLGGKKGHLWVRHRMTTQSYQASYPGARLSSFRRVARLARGRRGRCGDIHELMASFADHYVMPEDLDLYRLDPGREASLGISDYVVCRVCGARIKTSLSGSRHDHLPAMHGLNLQQYLTLWPRAPRCSAKNAKAVSTASYRWAKNHPDEVKRIQSRHDKKPAVRERRRTYSRNYSREVRAFAKIGRQRVIIRDKAAAHDRPRHQRHEDTNKRIELMAKLSVEGKSLRAMSTEVFSDRKSTPRAAYDAIRKLASDYRADFEVAKARLRTVKN